VTMCDGYNCIYSINKLLCIYYMAEIIDQLREKYADNEYMRSTLEKYVQGIPDVMKTMEDEYTQKCDRLVVMNNDKSLFIEEFMSEHQYLYIPQTESFVEYDGLNYVIVAEDDITHAILGKINRERRLTQWKYRLRLTTLKLIKTNTIWSTIPDSVTIQSLLSVLLPSVFKTKLLAKYFFTIIGDQLLGKKDGCVYFIDPSYRDILQAIAFQMYLLTSKSAGDCFKYKYHDHKYETCRILHGVCNSDAKTVRFVKANILNVIAVCVHYSVRYANAEGLLSRSHDTDFTSSVTYLTDHTPDTLVASFMSGYTIPSEDTAFPFKDLYFLWRHFLHKHSLPCVISQNNLKNVLVELKVYDRDGDKCLNISSRYPTYWVSFHKFWDTNVVQHEDINNSYKIEEMVTLYNDWCTGTARSMHIQDSQLLEILELEYPQVHVDDGKHIMRVNCILWDKTTVIDKAVKAFNAEGKTSSNVLNMYRFYCDYVNAHHDGRYIASKTYFEEYIE